MLNLKANFQTKTKYLGNRIIKHNFQKTIFWTIQFERRGRGRDERIIELFPIPKGFVLDVCNTSINTRAIFPSHKRSFHPQSLILIRDS